MRKRIFSLSLAVVMVFLSLAGCSQTGQETAQAPVQDSTQASTQAETEAPSAPAETAGPDTNYTYADTIAWDGQYDVVVVGFGGAGAVASATAADEGARVLLVEKAPEGHEGGNTRVCGQMFAYGAEDEEGTYEYYQALAGGHSIPEELLRVYTKNVAHMYDVMEELTGIPKSEYFDWTGSILGSMSPEYPEFPNAEKISLNALHEGFSDGFLWQTLRGLVTDRSDKIDVWFESPATHLIQDPQTKIILGVQVERDGNVLNIRADNGVILATGGFENDPEMVANYLGLSDYVVCGGLYNTGDGVRMAQEVGADLWHMEAYEGIGSMAGTSVSIPDEYASGTTTIAGNGGIILVGGDGRRYLNEGETSRHGHVRLSDAWVNVRRPLRSFIICEETVYQANASKIQDYALNVQHAGSIEELAELIDVDPESLSATVERFNGFVKDGYDPEFGRDAATMAPIAGVSFYAIAASANVLNTQGGPRRDENAQVLGLDGQPIPHLYSAGELGGMTAFQYQGGGNIAECVIFGKIAGKNAAAAKEALPVYEVPQSVESPLTYTPGAETDLGGSVDVALAEGEYLGVSHSGMGGDLYVKVTMDGDNIAKVEVVDHKETDGISDPAISQIPEAIVAANSAEVDSVSGATITSNAIKEAVADALNQVK